MTYIQLTLHHITSQVHNTCTNKNIRKSTQTLQRSRTLQKQSGCFNHRAVTQVAVSWRTVVIGKVYFGSTD